MQGDQDRAMDGTWIEQARDQGRCVLYLQGAWHLENLQAVAAEIDALHALRVRAHRRGQCEDGDDREMVGHGDVPPAVLVAQGFQR